MGMFDYVKCEVPLPDGWQPDSLMQTKSFDNQMACHVINAQGRLIFEKSTHQSDFSGVVNFYGGDDLKNWHEYNATFADGQLVGIELVPQA